MFPRRTKIAAAALAVVISHGSTAARAEAFDPSDEAQTNYVDGNIIFLAYHEVGHMILDQILSADQHGNRLAAEETADDIATWLMLPDPDEPQQSSDILAAIEGWSRGSGPDEGVEASPHYPDDGVRAARIACYLYGAQPDQYAELAELFRVSIGSVDCAEEVEAMQADFEAWFGDSMIPPAAPNESAITIAYEDAGGSLASAKAYLQESGLLEEAAEDIAQFVRLPNDVSIVARSCGAGAAEFRYSPSARRITACYEAVDWLMRDASNEEQEKAGPSASEGDELGSGGARVPRRPRPPRG